MTETKMLELALEQSHDLLSRGEARLEHLMELEGKAQPNVRLLSRERGRMVKWTDEDEASFQEKMAVRKPDALVQRYLLVRPSSKVIGIDATTKSVEALRVVCAQIAAALASASASAALV